jgi:hypothetical protein
MKRKSRKRDASADAAATTAAAATTNRSANAGSRLRLVILGVLVLAACYIAYGFGQLWAEWREAQQVSTHTKQPVAGAVLNPMVGALPLAGPWSFGDLEWNLKSTIVRTDEVPPRLEALCKPEPVANGAQLPDVGPELLEITTMLNLQPESRDGFELYRVNRHDLKGLLVARNIDGQAKVIAAAVAYPHAGDFWQLYELTPQGASPKIDTQAPHLLPLPENAVRRGGRFADDGRLLLELISLNSDEGSLIDLWRRAGWEVQPSGLGDAGGFSFLCRQGDDVMYAWSANSGEALKSLMLVRSPTDAEMQAQGLGK